MARTTTNGSPADLTTADLEDQIAALRADIAGLASSIATMGRTEGARLGAAVSDSADHLRAKAADATDAARLRAEALYSDAESQVRQNPAAALGIAAGLGFLVGLMTSRR